MSTRERWQRGFWLLAALLAPAVPLHVYFSGVWDSILHSYSLGMFFGLIGYVYLAHVLILSSRIRYFDRLFGHDRVMRFHGVLACVAIALILVHAVLKTQYFGTGAMHVRLGMIAFALFLLVAAATLLFMLETPLLRLKPLAAFRAFAVSRLGFDYSRLKWFHNLAAAALVLSAIHVRLASPTQENTTRLGVTGAWGAVAVLFYMRHKLLRLAVMFRNAFHVTDVRRLTPDIVEIRAASAKGPGLRHKPGQFGFVRLLSPACGIEEHPFTIASAPGASTTSFVVKSLGNYTTALTALPSGARLLFDGPYGRFTPAGHSGPFLFVAGGIGITPFISMLESWDQAGMKDPVTLLWTARTRADLTHHGFFEEVARRHALFRYTAIVTRERTEHPVRIDTALLRATLDPAAAGRTAAYLCGPSSLCRDTARRLRKLGLSPRAIHVEGFSFGW